MSFENYEKIIINLKNLGFWGRVSPYLMNEPLIDKDRMVKFIEITKKHLPMVRHSPVKWRSWEDCSWIIRSDWDVNDFWRWRSLHRTLRGLRKLNKNPKILYFPHVYYNKNFKLYFSLIRHI